MTGYVLPPGYHPAARDELSALPVEVAPRLLDGLLRVTLAGRTVAVRITEVEAYHGRGTGDRADPGSHARMGPTPRNATMWGEPGHLYVYLSHGIHSCVNVVCGPEGAAGGVLLRGGEIVEGLDAARERRPAARTDRDLARGPGRLGDAIGLRHALHDGIDAVGGGGGVDAGVGGGGGVDAGADVGVFGGAEQAGAVARLLLRDEPLGDIATGPRVGVAGVAGTAAFPWRFWVPGDPTVSAFRWGRGAAEAAATGVSATGGL